MSSCVNARRVGTGDLDLPLDRHVPERHVVQQVPVLLQVVVVERRDQHVVVQVPAGAARLHGPLVVRRLPVPGGHVERERRVRVLGHRFVPFDRERVAPLAVALDLADAVVRRDAGDAAAGVRGAGALIQAADRRAVVRVARRRPHVEELLRRQLAVEDVAADQAPLVLHVVRADHLAVQDAVREPGRQLVVAGDHAVGVGLQLVAVRLLAPPVRHPLREQRDDVLALRRERRVERRRHHAVGERQRRRPPRARLLERRLEVRDGVRQLDAAGLIRQLRVGREDRQPVERAVDLHHAAPRAPVLDVAHEVRRQLARVELLQERDLRVDRRDDQRARGSPRPPPA